MNVNPLRKISLIMLISLFFPVLLLSQKEKLDMSKAYRAWINNHKIVGILYQVNDSSIAVSRTIDDLYRTRDYKSLLEIDYKKITSLKICEVRKLRKGSLTGGLVGFLLGLPIGIMYGVNQTRIVNKEVVSRIPFPFLYLNPATAATLGGLITGFAGGLAGAGVGYPVARKSNSIIIPLDGTFNEFDRNRDLLKEYAYVK